MNNGNGAGARKVLLAGAIGNFVEWYDWGLYGLFATTIATQFFPKSAPTAALLSTFATLGAGYAIRPLGGIVFGRLGDRIGRRAVLISSVLLMSAGTVAVGLLPSYAQIGAMAPVLLVLCRLVQGFSAGGESTGGDIFLVEHAPPGKRGLFASVTPAMNNIGTLVGVLVAVVMTSTTTPEQLASWGWRLPFLAAAPLALVGLYLRLGVDESPVFAAARAEGDIASAPLTEAFRVAKKPMLVMFAWAITYTVTFGIITTFLLSYLNVTVKFSKTQSLVVQLVILVVAVVSGVLAGLLIEIVGRKRIAVVSALGMAIWAVPAFVLLENSTVLEACLIAGVLAVFAGGIGTTTLLAVVELFPSRVRSSASTLAYQIGIALFGGSTPYVATWLVNRTHLAHGPGYYLAGLCAIAAVVAAIGIGNRAQSRSEPDKIQATTESSQEASA